MRIPFLVEAFELAVEEKEIAGEAEPEGDLRRRGYGYLDRLIRSGVGGGLGGTEERCVPGYMVDKVRRLYEWGLITKTADRSVAGSSNQIIEELKWSIEDGYLRDPTESISEVDDLLWGGIAEGTQFYSAVALMDEYQERFFERGRPGIGEARKVRRVRSGVRRRFSSSSTWLSVGHGRCCAL